MKIRILLNNKGLLISPETEFERDWLGRLQNKDLKAFIKTGNDLTDILGLKIRISELNKGKDHENKNNDND